MNVLAYSSIDLLFKPVCPGTVGLIILIRCDHFRGFRDTNLLCDAGKAAGQGSSALAVVNDSFGGRVVATYLTVELPKKKTTRNLK